MVNRFSGININPAYCKLAENHIGTLARRSPENAAKETTVRLADLRGENAHAASVAAPDARKEATA